MPDERKPSNASKQPAEQDVAGLTDAGITDAEVSKLRAAGVRTAGELWRRVARGGLGELELKTKIEGQRLVELLPARRAEKLAAELLYRAERDCIVAPGRSGARRRRPALRRRARQTAGRVEVWVRHHLLDLMFLGGVALVAFLLLRAGGKLYALPPPWGLRARYAVAAHDLRKGEALRPGQMHFVMLPPARDYFTSADGLEGLILARDVPGQKPLRQGDLLRLQAVAARDIAPGETVAAADLRLEWRPLQTTAVLRAADAENARARLAIRKDDVVTAEQLAR